MSPPRHRPTRKPMSRTIPSHRSEKRHMTGRLEGKVAFITGAARGQGRSHALRLAEEGADIIAIDICAEVEGVEYDAATIDDLRETVKLVEGLDRRVVSRQLDVRDRASMQVAIDEGVAELGRLDIVVANAGIVSWDRFWEMSTQKWQDMIDVNLTGVFHTLAVATPHIIAGQRGGSIVITSSVAGTKALPGQAHYAAAKHGVVGLMKAAAIELAPFDIRVNSIHPWGVNTHMGQKTIGRDRLLEENPSYVASFNQLLHNPPIAEPKDISEAVLYLVSSASRLVTGAEIPVDAGATKI